MNEERADWVHLRRYQNPDEARFHTWTQDTLSNILAEKGNFLRVEDLRYSNNPHLRRNQVMFDDGVLPLREFFDSHGKPIEHKGAASWTKCEMKAKSVKNAWIHKWGMFVHDMPILNSTAVCGCNKYTGSGISTCKYGFYQWNIGYCQFCDASKGITDIFDHDKLYLDTTHYEKIDYATARKSITPCVSDDFSPSEIDINKYRRESVAREESK